MYYVNNVHSKLLLYGEQVLTLAIDVIVLKFYKIPLIKSLTDSSKYPVSHFRFYTQTVS